MKLSQTSGQLFIQEGSIYTQRSNGVAAFFSRQSDYGDVVQFYDQDDDLVGRVTINSNSTVSYNTSSDERLKENIEYASNSGNLLNSIKVRQFDWKKGGSHQNYGMIAQELITVVPDAVTAGETSEDMMGVDYSKLVPLLVKTIQELEARITALENP